MPRYELYISDVGFFGHVNTKREAIEIVRHMFPGHTYQLVRI